MSVGEMPSNSFGSMESPRAGRLPNTPENVSAYLEWFGGHGFYTTISEEESTAGLHLVRLNTQSIMPPLDSTANSPNQEILVVGLSAHEYSHNEAELLVKHIVDPFFERNENRALLLVEGGFKLEVFYEIMGNDLPLLSDIASIPDEDVAHYGEQALLHLRAVKKSISVRSAEPYDRGIGAVREFIREHEELKVNERDLVTLYTMRNLPQFLKGGVTDPAELERRLEEAKAREFDHDSEQGHLKISIQQVIANAKRRLTPDGDKFFTTDEAGKIALDCSDVEGCEKLFRLHTTSEALPPPEERSALQHLVEPCTDARRAAFFRKLIHEINKGFSVFFMTHSIHSKAIASDVRKVPIHPLSKRDSVFWRRITLGYPPG